MTFQQRRQQVEDACAEIILAGKHVTSDDVAARTGLGRATLYRTPTYARSSKNTAPAAKKHTPSPGSPPRSPTSASRWTPSPPPCDATKKKSADYESQKAANESLCSSEDLAKICRITMAQRLRRILQLPHRRRMATSTSSASGHWPRPAWSATGNTITTTIADTHR
jgi:hypothetical protein